jgi:HD-GYP domain-containing protein (c-di-GMP phosphodiesterase class II)
VSSAGRDIRSIAHLKMLQSLAPKLNRSHDLGEIGTTIENELRLLIDYHNCRVFVREGDELLPIGLQGRLTAPGLRPAEAFRTRVGEGITGHVVEAGETLILDDASACEFAVEIEGAKDIEESILAVPLKHGTRSIGAIVVSKLGLNQFDEADARLLEVLAGHAAVALENARLYEAQRREAEGAKALLEFGRGLAGAEGSDRVLDLVLEGAARILDAPHASLWLQGEPGGDLLGRAEIGYPSGHEILGRRYSSTATEPFRGRTEPFFVTPEEYAAFADPPPDSSGTYAIAPFSVDGRWGVIAVASRAGRCLGERELELLGGLAHQAKLAIANTSSFEGLEQTFLSTVEALANALEARDHETSSHARWITDTALRVGSELGLDGRAMKRLELGALFHDIGKIGIPNSILLKPSPLTPDEQRLIETHPELGERILAAIDQLRDVRVIVRACHERWDGEGYPDGLAGEEIPMESRIVFACDAFHTMTTGRPYRRALPVEEALHRLRDAAGTQFDPAVVEVCLRVLPGTPAPTRS